MSSSACARCEGPVDLHDVYVIGYSKQSAMEWVHLCKRCEAELREWIAAGSLDLHGGSL